MCHNTGVKQCQVSRTRCQGDIGTVGGNFSEGSTPWDQLDVLMQQFSYGSRCPFQQRSFLISTDLPQGPDWFQISHPLIIFKIWKPSFNFVLAVGNDSESKWRLPWTTIWLNLKHAGKKSKKSNELFTLFMSKLKTSCTFHYRLW